MVQFQQGANHLRAVAHSGASEISDDVALDYQTEKWGTPEQLALTCIATNGNVERIAARLVDSRGVLCLDATERVHFDVTGDAELLDDLGTPDGSRLVGLANGRAQINLRFSGHRAVASVACDGVPTAFLDLSNSDITPLSGNSESFGARAMLVSASNIADPDPPLIDVAAIDRQRILKAANAALNDEPFTITKFRAKLSEGGPHDFYSNGDYWWPDPSKPGGLPYIRRDGESNPENFNHHRMEMRRMRNAVAALAAAYKITGENRYATKAAELLRVFFLDPKTRMNPNLKYAQAIPGITPGRGVGIIDTLHMAEVPMAILAMENSPAFPTNELTGLKRWFSDYTDWMLTSKNGQDEANAHNNHAVAILVAGRRVFETDRRQGRS